MPSDVTAEPPPISDPDGRAEGPAMPGTFPEIVTAANVNAAPISGSEIGGEGSDNIQVSFPAAGPIVWTESRHNEGDIALLVGPFDPADASYFPPAEFVNSYSPLEQGQPFANTTLAWRVSRNNGALLATVRHNGVDNGDMFSGSPVGTIHGVAYFNADFGQGWGFRMDDGVFANGASASADLQMGVAGFDQGTGEAVFNTAAAFFPYVQGWQGAYVQEGVDGPGGFAHSTPGLDPSAVNWTNGVAQVTLPDVDSANDGMLFVAPTNGGNATDFAAAFPNNGGWSVTVREDEEIDLTGMTYNIGANGFQFLYVPYTASGLIGGHVEGTDGSLVNSAGDESFSLTRSSTGEYALSVLDSDGQTKLTEDDGMLILSVAGSLPGSTTLADRTFLSYEFDSQSGDFVIQSRSVTASGDPGNSENVFGDVLSLTDSDFYFAFVDFANPLAPTAPELAGDLNGDDLINFGDLTPFVMALTDVPGYETMYPELDRVARCDTSGDGMCNFGDLSPFVALLTGGPASSSAVPEPGAALLALVAAAACAMRRRAMR
jgi:hypothetical protein